MSQYYTAATLKGHTIAPSSYIDAIEALETGWTDGRLKVWSGWLDARLIKRYAAPFAAPYPDQILIWLEMLVRVELYEKRGVDATDAQIVLAREDQALALAQVREAADSNTGLFELPLRQDLAGISGVSAPVIRVYSEAGPYNALRIARARERDEPIVD